ncbi:hypothetical protein DMENIID0001_034530 [Sergentomyia squamirostris]
MCHESCSRVQTLDCLRKHHLHRHPMSSRRHVRKLTHHTVLKTLLRKNTHHILLMIPGRKCLLAQMQPMHHPNRNLS